MGAAAGSMGGQKRVSGRGLWVAGGASLVAAIVVNLIVLAAGRAAGAEFMVPDPSSAGALVAVSPVMVILATVFGLGLGVVAAALLAPRIQNGILVFQVLAGVLAVLSLGAPFQLEDTTSRGWLAAMHLLSGALFVAGLQLAKRRGAQS